VSAATGQRLQGLFFVGPQEMYWKREQKLCKNLYKAGTLSLCHAILRTSGGSAPVVRKRTEWVSRMNFTAPYDGRIANYFAIKMTCSRFFKHCNKKLYLYVKKGMTADELLD
jgi:hypothetical protein